MEKYISLDQIRKMVEVKEGVKLKWETSRNASEEVSNFIALVPEEVNLTDIECVVAENDNLDFEIWDSNENEVNPVVILWESELLDLPSGEKGLLTEGALNGILVINNQTVTREDLVLIS